MFSIDRFYHIIHDNLISNFKNSKSFYFYPFGSYELRETIYDPRSFNLHESRYTYYHKDKIPTESAISFPIHTKAFFHCHFYDQEPLFPETPLPIKFERLGEGKPNYILIVANSEKSEFKQQRLKEIPYSHDWYYFFHGFAALDWYRDFQYYDSNAFETFDKVFICYNHLISNYRSYRIHLVANLIEHNLVDKGYVSFFLKDQYGHWTDAVNDPHSLLDARAKLKINNTLPALTDPLIIDVETPNGNLSANVQLKDLTKAFWHVITETIYFQEKLHLTEKTFKPIVAKRPFILVGAPGNLAYLKSYGFKTFDRWIDESYDQETDNFLRIEKITMELKKLCELSPTELRKMHQEMKEVLEFNYQHFYTDFKKIIVDELVDNFMSILNVINHGRMPNNHSSWHHIYEYPEGHIQEVKRKLLK